MKLTKSLLLGATILATAFCSCGSSNSDHDRSDGPKDDARRLAKLKYETEQAAEKYGYDSEEFKRASEKYEKFAKNLQREYERDTTGFGDFYAAYIKKYEELRERDGRRSYDDSYGEAVETPYCDSSYKDSDSMDNEGPVLELNASNSNIEPTSHPVVIDFNATWCGPCQQFGPVFHKVAEEYSYKAMFASADVDVCTELASQYQVSSIPAILILYPDGRDPVSTVGYMTEDEFKAFLDENL